MPDISTRIEVERLRAILADDAPHPRDVSVEIARLKSLMSAADARLVSVSSGERPATAEEIAAEINRATDQIARGDADLVDDIDL